MNWKAQVIEATEKRLDEVRRSLNASLDKAIALVQELKTSFGPSTTLLIMRESGAVNGLDKLDALLDELGTESPKRSAKRAPKGKKEKPPAGRNEPKKLTLEELKKLVPKAIEATAGNQFTRDDIVNILAEHGRADTNQVSLVLTNYVTGIKKVGTKPRKGGGGRPMNLYAATSKRIRVRNIVRKSK